MPKQQTNSEFVREIEKEFHTIEEEMDNMLSHPNCREILQEEEAKMHMSDKLWTSMLPRIKHFIAAVATDIIMWNIR